MIKISACAIAKNEEQNISRWLDSVRRFADEIIVADTGSTDRTREIAVRAGAKVVDFSWCDDFAAAKNFAIEQAGGDWVVMPDADEFFAPGSAENVRKILLAYHRQKDVLGFILPCTNIDAERDNEVLSHDWRLRIFRNEPQLRYVGVVHEALRNFAAGEEARRFILLRDLQLIHTGYSAAGIRDKLRRNLKLLRQDIEANGLQARHYGYLQDCYAGLEEYDKAVYYGRLALRHRLESGLLGQTNSLICKYLNSIRLSGLGDYEHELAKAVREFPDLPEVWFLYGQHLLAQMDGLEAEKALREAARLFARPVTDVQELRNQTMGNIAPIIEGYLQTISRYRPYYQALAGGDYRKASTLAARYLLAAYHRYPAGAEKIAYLFSTDMGEDND